MPEFLSPEWIEALAAAARAAPPPAAPAHPLVVEYLLTDDRDPGGADEPAGRGAVPGGSRDAARYHVAITPDAIRVTPGPADRADLVFVTDRATAYALHRGSLLAQDAFAAGRLKVRGDLNALAGVRSTLAALGDVFAAVRAGTTPPRDGYDPDPAAREADP